MKFDQTATGSDSGSAVSTLSRPEKANWKAHALVEKWDADQTTWAQQRAERKLRKATPADLAALVVLHERMALGYLPPADVLANARLLNTGKLTGTQLQVLVGEADDVTEWAGNLLCNAGIQRLEDLLIGAGGQAFTNTWARIGTGNGAGTAAAADTDMSAAAGAANRWYQSMDATFPSRAAQTLSFKSTFGTADGNYAWNEWGVDNGGAGSSTNSAVVGAPLLNHKTSAALGTKASGATWAFTGTIAIS